MTVKNAGSLARRWSVIEAGMIERCGRPGGGGLPLRRVPPALFVISVVLWTLSSTSFPSSVEQMRLITPWVGLVAMTVQGLYTARVAFRIAYVCDTLGRHFDAPGETLRPVRGALLPVLNIAFGVIVFAGIYCYQVVEHLGDVTNITVTHLLWMLTTGGLMIAILFGEMVLQLVALIERFCTARADA